jgi:hypothetical protein
MCDNDSIKDTIEYELRTGGLSRRKFSALTLGVGLASALPPTVNAAETKESDVEIKTQDGTADAYFVHPATGKHPGVLVWPDIFGLRPDGEASGGIRLFGTRGKSVLPREESADGTRASGLQRSADAADADESA